MMMYKRILMILLTGILLGILCSCTTTPTNTTTYNSQWSAWYQQWHGTPYRYGGNSQRGVDCSALVQDAFRSIYRLKLPRTTSEQKRLGNAISVRQLQVGDLLFFKPDRTTNHVGIYLGKQRFVHASSSKGVTISPLDNSYWLPRLSQARRILN